MFRKQIHSSKWSCKTDGEAYPLTLADMDFPLYEPFKKKLVDQMTKLNNLTYKDRSCQYFDALTQWYRKNHSVQLSREVFVESPSLCNLIACSILAFTKQHYPYSQNVTARNNQLVKQQQKVLVFTPVYSFYMKSIKNLNRKVVTYELKEVAVDKGGNDQPNFYRYEFDKNSFAMIMDQQKPMLVILCHPHNPSGKIFTKQQLDFIVKKAQQHDSYILSDQIMGDFSLFPSKNKFAQHKLKFISLSSYSYDKIIVGNSISKVFNCESVQGGYGIIRCQTVRKQYQKISNAVKLLTNQMSLILSPIVYSNDGEKWISYINEIIETNFTLLKETLSAYQQVKLFDIEASYLTTIEFNFKSKYSQSIPNKYLAAILASYKIYFTDMQEYIYPETSRNLFRISIAIHPDEFKKFIIKFKECLGDMNKYFAHKNTRDNLSDLQKSKL